MNLNFRTDYYNTLCHALRTSPCAPLMNACRQRQGGTFPLPPGKMYKARFASLTTLLPRDTLHGHGSKYTEMHLWPELRPTPRWGNFEHSRDPQAGFKEPFRGGEVRARWRGKQGSGARKDRDRKERERIG